MTDTARYSLTVGPDIGTITRDTIRNRDIGLQTVDGTGRDCSASLETHLIKRHRHRDSRH